MIPVEKNKYLIINSPTGGAPIYLLVTVVDGIYYFSNVSVVGLNLTTAGVTDTLDKRFVTDAELAQIVVSQSSEQLLSTTNLVDLNTATPTPLYTVPPDLQAIITRIVVRNASAGLVAASISFGFNSAAFNDLIATATHAELTGATLFSILTPKAGAKIGAAADVLKVLANVLQGSAVTVSIDVFGYLVAA